jgi:hypothetical protein
MAKVRAEAFRVEEGRIGIRSHASQAPERVKATDVEKGKTDETLKIQNNIRP